MLLDIKEWIGELNEVHLDHLGRCWLQWRGASRSPELSLRQVRRIEGRIDAHADALLLAGERARVELESALLGDQDDLARSAADVMLLGALPDGADLLRAALLTAPTPERADLLLDAIWLRPSPMLCDSLAKEGASAPPVLQIADRLAHAALQRTPRSTSPLKALRASDDGAVRRWAWTLTALDAGEPLERSVWEAQVANAQPELRDALFAAAAWRRQDWLSQVLRERAAHDLIAARWLAVLGSVQDYEPLLAVARSEEFGPERFLVLASLGDARALPFLVEACAIERPADASAAAWAFRLLSGVDVHSLERVASLPPDAALPDAFDALFLDEVFLPERDKARAWLDEHGAELAAGRRWRRALAIDELQGAALDGVDPLAILERAWRARRNPTVNAAARMPGSVYPLALG